MRHDDEIRESSQWTVRHGRLVQRLPLRAALQAKAVAPAPVAIAPVTVERWVTNIIGESRRLHGSLDDFTDQLHGVWP